MDDPCPVFTVQRDDSVSFQGGFKSDIGAHGLLRREDRDPGPERGKTAEVGGRALPGTTHGDRTGDRYRRRCIPESGV